MRQDQTAEAAMTMAMTMAMLGEDSERSKEVYSGAFSA